MSRFDYFEFTEEGIPAGLWDQMVSRALAGKKGQAVLAQLEAALLALPEKKLVFEFLASEGSVCAVGAYVAQERADRCGTDLATEVARMNDNARCGCGHTLADHKNGGPCSAKRRSFGAFEEFEDCTCKEFDQELEDIYQTAEAGQGAGLKWALAWHLAWLNDQHFDQCSAEERYEKMLAWVRRALGKEPVNA